MTGNLGVVNYDSLFVEKSRKVYGLWTDTAEGLTMVEEVIVPSVRALIEEPTIVSGQEKQVEKGFRTLEELISWTRMHFKAKKSRSVFLKKGKIVVKRFQVNGEDISWMSERG